MTIDNSNSPAFSFDVSTTDNDDIGTYTIFIDCEISTGPIIDGPIFDIEVTVYQEISTPIF